MRYFGGRGPESPALEMHQDLVDRQTYFDQNLEGLAAYHLPVPETRTYGLSNNTTLTVVNAATGRGGSYKAYNAAGGVATLPEGIREGVTATAGNFGGEFGWACKVRGLASVAFTPDILNPTKDAGMDDADVRVVRTGLDVGVALDRGLAYAAERSDREFVHPYNNPWGLAAMRYLGGFVMDALRKQDAAGLIDLQNKPTDILVPLGGGSGVAGLASYLRSEKDDGNMPEHTNIFAVRPARLRNGMMNERFDGLRVAVPGSNTAPFLEDRRFVAGTRLVGEAAVADATRFMAQRQRDAGEAVIEFEGNGLITVARGLQDRAEVAGMASSPRNIVALVTGKNSDPRDYSYFSGLGGYKTTTEYADKVEARLKAHQADKVRARFDRAVASYHRKYAGGIDEIIKQR